MTDSVRDLIPIAPTDSLVRAWSFRLLLDKGRPIADSELVLASGLTEEEVREEAASIAGEGRLTRDDSGRIIGSAGLTVVPTAHSLVIAGQQRWTWCAVDAVGIMTALQATGEITSADFSTGDPITLSFTDGHAEATDVVVFVAAEGGDDCYVVDEWCPTVNFFVDRPTAEAWAARHEPPGEIADIGTVAEASADGWRELLELAAHQEGWIDGHRD